MEAILKLVFRFLPASAGRMASLFHAAPYREPRKYEAGNRRNVICVEKRRHDP